MSDSDNQIITTEIENSNKKTLEKKKINSGMIILIILAVLSLVTGFAKLMTILSNNTLSGNVFGGKYLACINIEGTIEAKNQTYDQEWLLETIEKLSNDKKNAGLVITIDSPGGGVYESDQVYLALLDYKTTNKPVFAYFEALAASGGYYIGCAADYIFANRNTLTGSIGVIAGQSIDLTELMKNLGIKMTTITAGKNKNMGNINSVLTPEQKDILQSIADEAYLQFTEIVAESRELDIETVWEIADGRIYTALQALELNLIDEIATYNNAISDIKTYAMEDENIPIVYFSPEYKKSFYDYLLYAAKIFNPTAESLELNMIKERLLPSTLTYPAYYYE